MSTPPSPLVWSTDQVRRYLVSHHRLRHPTGRGHHGVRELLASARCIQLDPLDRVGTNADLVALARVDDLRRGEVYDALLPGHAFEHFAKERCLLPASAFPAWRHRALQAPWRRLAERSRRVPAAALTAVLHEVRARGPIAIDALTDRGAVEALDWSGWKGTTRMATMAAEILWTRCQIVVCGRTTRGKVVDIPERALPDHAAAAPPSDVDRWQLRERAWAAGLLPTAAGPWWSGLRHAKAAGTADAMVRDGELIPVRLTGSRRSWLAPADAVAQTRIGPTADDDDDGRMRILGPLDPMIWDRKLVEAAFGFTYVWEVYKPAAKRRWGYYVCPLLHRGQLVGRFEGRQLGPELVVDRLWEERPFDRSAWRAARERHAAACAP